jgi:sialic acid synthase SpsE
MNTFVIAEAGANHNKNFKQALALIDVAIDDIALPRD